MIKDTTSQAAIKALKMLDAGEPRHKILGCLIDEAEAMAGPGSASSILILDQDGLLRNGYSPKLPYDYVMAIDGLKPDPFVGTCAAAAATGAMVITRDFKSDDKWAELRHLPLALGYSGAWSMPIKTTEGKVLGTFGTYFTTPRDPSENEIQSVARLAEVAARVLA